MGVLEQEQLGLTFREGAEWAFRIQRTSMSNASLASVVSSGTSQGETQRASDRVTLPIRGQNAMAPSQIGNPLARLIAP